MTDVAINNGNNTSNNMLKAVGISATAGAVFSGGATYRAQSKMLQHSDEFIKTFEGEIASAKGFNTPFLRGTQEAADLANKCLDENLQKVKDFINKGKHDYKAVAKAAGVGAIRTGLLVGAVYGAYLLIRNAIKGGAKLAAEGIAEAKADKT